MSFFQYIDLLFKSLMNLLLLFIDKKRVDLTNDKKLSNYILKIAYFLDISKILV